MDIKELIEWIMHEVLIEGIGIVFGIGAIGYIVFGGVIADTARAFATVFCG